MPKIGSAIIVAIIAASCTYNGIATNEYNFPIAIGKEYVYKF